MVGFKTIWLLLTLLIFAACVPQTKQTECKSNEAFNAALRTCVPVVNGPSSFINIDSFLPTSPLTKYKNDTTPITFSVVISNPYAQTYTVTWERIYNGVPVSLAPTTPTSYSFAPSLLASEIGTHIIAVKVRDANNAIVDSHSFEIKINDNPKPVIDSVTVTPALYNSTFTPYDTNQSFQFTVKNNGATMAGAGYRTDWAIYKNSTLIISETDTFPTAAPVGSLSTNGFNYPVYVFSPSTLGAGSYLVRARVTNTAAEVVAEQQWSVTVNHPSLSKVTARNIYSATATPAFGTQTRAYYGVAYSSSPTYNFVPIGQVAQGDYCVTVADGEGTYSGDSQYVRVDFYIDGAASWVYSGTTSAIDNKICLSDAPAGTLAAVMFTTISTTHSLVARVTDERTGAEYTAADMNPSLGSYPISWSFDVRQPNTAPVVGFTANGNLSPSISCGVPSSTSRTCTVAQDTAFTVGITATDEFYSTSSTTDSEQNKFTYTMVLSRNGTPISTCAKTTADVGDLNTLGADFTGPDYLCSFTVPSYDASGSVDPDAFVYSISIIFSDVGSPIVGATGLSGNTITYNLNVTETNTVPVIDDQGATIADSYLANAASGSTPLSTAANDSGAADTYVTEGDTLNFNVLVNDAERDDHQVNVYRCTDGTSACTTTALVATQTVNKTNNALGTSTLLTYTIPEDFVPVNTPFGTNVDAFFKISVTDLPDNYPTTPRLTAETSTLAPVHFNVNVRNKNPAPIFGGTPAPALGASITTFVGYKLSIDPGTVTDASAVASESSISYQWYVDVNGGDDSYTAITGATSRLLDWTPSNGIAAGTTINLAICASDGTAVNPQPALGSIGAELATPASPTGSNCLGSWDVLVQQNAVALNFDNGSGDLGNDIAVWQDTTVAGKRVVYSAYNDDSGYIYVEKTVFDAAGKIYNLSTDGFQTVRFDALDSAAVAVSTIKDISISGTSTHLYIAYQAATSGNPGSPKIRVRRIDKRTGAPVGTKTDPTYHDTGMFGFRYAQTLPTASQTTPNIIISAPIAGQNFEVTFNGDLTAGDQVIVHGVTFTAANGATPLCSGGAPLSCSDGGNATLLANAINNSTSRSLQGVTAVVSSNTVQIFGDVGGESADANATGVNMSSYTTGKLGKIFTYHNGINWEWHLPFVDLTTGSTMSNIRVLTASAEPNDFLSAVNITDTVVYTGIGAVNWFTNDFYNGIVTIASVNTSSVAKMHVFPIGASVHTSAQTLFSGAPISAGTLRVAGRAAGNAFYYAAARVLVTTPSTYEWKMGRYNSSLAISVEDTFTNLAFNAGTTSVLDVDSIADISIESLPSAGATTEARLLVSSNNGTGDIALLTGDYDLYAVRFRSDNDLSCDKCVPITYGTQELSPTKRIASARVDTDMALGSTAGSPVDRDVLFTAFSVDSDSDNNYEPQVGIINVEVESISTTSTTSTGLEGFRPPFFGSN